MTEKDIQAEAGKKGGKDKNTLYCSFCGKSQHEVRKLIAGPTVFICDECVELCMDIVREENRSSLVSDGQNGDNSWDDWRHETPSHELLREYFFTMARGLKANLSSRRRRSSAYRVLLAGVKGSGLADAISDIWWASGLPIIRYDAALLRNTHLIKSTDMFAQLFQQADFNLERASAGAILIENIDRIFDRSPECRKCQEELELLMRGVQVPIQVEDNAASHPAGASSKDKIQLDTSGISFIAVTNRLHLEVPAVVVDEDKPGLRFDRSGQELRAGLVSVGALEPLIDQFSEVREFLPMTGGEIEDWLSTPAAKKLLTSLNLPLDGLDADVRKKLVDMTCARKAGFEGLKSILRLAALRQSFAAPDEAEEDANVFDVAWLDRRF